MIKERNQAPNILFIQVDQLAASALQMYGNPVCQTPNLDRLAGEGIVFDNAYCNYPLCAPSRFSMAAGLLPSKIAAFDNGAEFPSSVPTYAHYLRGLGYYTVLSGKMHFVGADQLHGFEERLTADLYPADFQWSANWRETMHQDVTDSRMFDISGICLNSPQIEYDQRVAFEAERKLLELAKSDNTQAFFMQVSFTHPHDPYLCLQQYWDLYEGIDIPLPSVPESMIGEHDPHSQTLLKQSGLSNRIVSDDELRKVRRAYYGAISFIDEKIGRLLAILDDSALADNTVIVFTSDHGEMDEAEFTDMVNAVREAESAIGNVDYTLTEKQKKGKDFSRSLYVVEDIKKGELITEQNVRSVRPGFGMHPKFQKDILGKKAIRDLEKGDPMHINSIEK